LHRVTGRLLPSSNRNQRAPQLFRSGRRADVERALLHFELAVDPPFEEKS
jgi:hypothetical protein